jgi:adenine-specific DNA-methyltransferase
MRLQENIALWSEPHLVATALLLGARNVSGWTMEEERLTSRLPPLNSELVDQIRKKIQRGQDPLGDLLTSIRPGSQRRQYGATYTPLNIVQSMVSGIAHYSSFGRIVDPGVGSARFLLAAARRFRRADLIGIEIDAVAAIIARGNLAAAGVAERSEIRIHDYRNFPLEAVDGRTLYIGNPPYVRHHLIETNWKEWLVREASRLRFRASQLAGLHVHFFLRTALNASHGDVGVFITAAEWLDVNYGALVRELFLGRLGGQRLILIEPTATPFPDAVTTAVITSFEVGSQPRSVRVKRIEDPDDLSTMNGGRLIRRERLESETRWSHQTRRLRPEPAGYIELGELCRVHRGQVTGANKIWIAGPHSNNLPDSVLFPSVTKARELITSGLVLQDASRLRYVIDLPVDLTVFNEAELRSIEQFLRAAKNAGADRSFIARNRKAWWSVGLYEPAPILATYMARRPPAFVRNLADARHINIAHGLYPREPLPERVLTRLVSYLASMTDVADGRTYAGGLTKFEPREMERILVPSPELLVTT